MTTHDKHECGCGTGGSPGAGAPSEEERNEQRLRTALQRIRHKILVFSGKGGVGKSTVAVNLAVTLAQSGLRVGLLDLDFHGPSVPTLLGLRKERAVQGGAGILPVEAHGLKVMSVAFLLEKEDAAVIWRGPMKMATIRQLLTDVEWGDLDALVFDAPPGTGDEPLSICQLIPDADGAILVTTPQEVALSDVRRSIRFCEQLHLPVLGVIENMAGFACPACGEIADIFRRGGGERMAGEMQVPFLGAVPLDAAIVRAGDGGVPYVQHAPDAPASVALREAVAPIVERCMPSGKDRVDPEKPDNQEKEITMRIAVPVSEGVLSMHFGHCDSFALFDIHPESKVIEKRVDHIPPPHEPGVLPKWLAELGATAILAGGMGNRAQSLFVGCGIDVLTGAPAEDPETVVRAYLDGTLARGENVCDH